MFERVKIIADGLRNFSKRVGYVAKIIVWCIESLGKLAAILDTFPKSDLAVHNESQKSEDNGKQRTESMGGSSITSVPEKQV